MAELGYDGQEMFKKGRFRPATFWKSLDYELIETAVHKDRTLLTAFQAKKARQSGDALDDNKGDGSGQGDNPIWYVLNCHLQAGPNGGRRVRQINEGVRASLTLARKLKGKYRTGYRRTEAA